MWPSADEPYAGSFVEESVRHAPPGVRDVVLVPRLVLPRLHGRIWGTGAQGWQRGWVTPPTPHRLLEYRTARLPKRGETALRARGVDRVLAGEDVDLVHGHFLLGVGPAAVRVAHARGIPVVLTAHGTDVAFLEDGLPDRLRDEILEACASARVVAVSRALAERLGALGVEHVGVLSMGVDEATFRPSDRAEARRALGVADDERVVLFVGRLSQAKGADELIDAATRLGVRAYAAGAAQAPPPLHALGVLDRAALARWLAAADVMCLPSHSEGMPVSVMESLAVGTPVVATTVGGIPDQITPGVNGLLVPARDAEALASALDAALSRSWDAATIRRTSEPFWWSAVSERLGAIYREAL